MIHCYAAKLSYVLLLMLCLTALEAQAQSSDLVIEGGAIESGTYEASGTVTARNATVESGSDVTLRAAEGVRLEAGFKAEAGSYFRAEIDPDAQSQTQTSDPLVAQQQYLFDAHRLGEAWNYTTGSPDTKIGVYSMLGFMQSHEDLPGSRVLAPQGGGATVPGLDFATEMVGVVGAATDNGVGMAGIDRAARFQSYSVLTRNPSYRGSEEQMNINTPNGSIETFYLDLLRFEELLAQGRQNGVDVHLFATGIPAGDDNNFAFDDLPSPDSPDLSDNPDPDLARDDPLRQSYLNTLLAAFDEVYKNLCGVPGDFLNLLGDCSLPPDPQKLFREEIGFAVAQGQTVVAPAGDLSAAGKASIRYLPANLGRYSIAVGGLGTV